MTRESPLFISERFVLKALATSPSLINRTVRNTPLSMIPSKITRLVFVDCQFLERGQNERLNQTAKNG